MRLSRILQLRPPKWDAVKRQFDKNKDTTYGKVFAAIIGVTAFGVAAAFIWPLNPVVMFLGGYGLACFYPTLNLLQLRKWNRTLAFPAALIYTAMAVIGLLTHFHFDNVLAVLFLFVTFMIGATSDRLSFTYKWKPPFDHIGIVAAAFLIYLIVYLMFMVFFMAVVIFIIIIACLLLMIRSFFGFGRRRGNRWW